MRRPSCVQAEHDHRGGGGILPSSALWTIKEQAETFRMGMLEGKGSAGRHITDHGAGSEVEMPSGLARMDRDGESDTLAGLKEQYRVTEVEFARI